MGALGSDCMRLAALLVVLVVASVGDPTMPPKRKASAPAGGSAKGAAKKLHAAGGKGDRGPSNATGAVLVAPVEHDSPPNHSSQSQPAWRHPFQRDSRFTCSMAQRSSPQGTRPRGLKAGCGLRTNERSRAYNQRVRTYLALRSASQHPWSWRRRLPNVSRCVDVACSPAPGDGGDAMALAEGCYWPTLAPRCATQLDIPNHKRWCV